MRYIDGLQYKSTIARGWEVCHACNGSIMKEDTYYNSKTGKPKFCVNCVHGE